MQSTLALLRREFIEHRTLFVIVPGLMLGAVVIMALYGIYTNGLEAPTEAEFNTRFRVVDAGLMAIFGLWTVYLIIALIFFVADAFHADRRNNALLFWKSMPQSDLKILGTKLLIGATVFPAFIFCWAILTGIAGWVLMALIAGQFGLTLPFDAGDTLGTFFNVGLAGLVYIALTLIWYAPLFGWVALMGTLFKGWAVPIAIVVPSVLVTAEQAITLGGARGPTPVSDFLSWRFEGLLAEEQIPAQFLSLEPATFTGLVGDMFANLDLAGTLGGLAFLAAAIWLASEYRRRRIEA